MCSALVATPADIDRRRSGLAFARRVYVPRMIGLGLGFFYVTAVLYNLTQPAWVWGILFFNGFLWPHLALLLARRAGDPMRFEYGNLRFDACMGGVWIGMMGLNSLPSVLIMSMMGMNNIAAGGLRLFVQGLAIQLTGALGVIWLAHRPIAFATTPEQIYFCLPMLFIYPISVGWVTYRTAIKLAEHKRQLREISIHDGMTRLYNRHHWEQLLKNEFEQCVSRQQVATLALLDIDHFKRINDSFGHHVGDDVILLLSGGIKSTLRQSDITGRFGGDEFGMVLPRTPTAEAERIVQRLREYLASIQLHQAPALRVGISVGLVQFHPGMADYQVWLKAADTALYRAKDNGRGCTVCA
ncbi:diguanylate cyclase [Dickeya solani]|uniref:diguanylate cyclase n=2 Tax=Dickeya solani TaxID=1089444 RepID=A0ABU4EBN5_9GAMM|nr:diguanylate cyclase [Dickeya solani]ANE76663.1 diguanylate cyclase AdrA [Dickeya solani IPO 2222]AUC44317.1 Putative Heme-regulated two-component response regulator [Dickeya solani RNS 08.23.3.1.A]AUH07926.1 diguanylate cyclase AdrA [Dickeya solani D s0432-1]AUH11948.1 diguanylate cyclase AdrA [Dickeya solani]AYQ47169.1 putative diguanylate cyclase AdrA [Dickeya solani]